MSVLVVIGIIFLVLVACYFTFATGALMLLGVGFAGRVDAPAYVFAALAIAMWYAVYHYWPFTISITTGT